MKQLLPVFFLASSLCAGMDLYQLDEPKVSVQNSILTKVNDNTISVIDVMKKMDFILHERYPDLADSPQARMQFYTINWKHVFSEMVDNELILADAEVKEIKLTDGELREEIERRFGPSVQVTLDKMNLSYEDARSLIKKEMIVQRMMWFFVHSKAINGVTPQEIRQAYKQYLVENPAYREWKYRVFTIRTPNDNPSQQLQQAHEILAAHTPETALEALKQWEANYEGSSIQISSEYSVKEQDLSDAHKKILASLTEGTYSAPETQMSRAEKRPVHRIFYLVKMDDHPAPAFEDLADRLKGELVNQAIAQQSSAYLQKLRVQYGFDSKHLKESVPDDLQPFQLQQ